MKKYLGVLMPVVDQYYQRNLIEGIQKKALDLGYNLLFFHGGNLDSPIEEEKNKNVIYSLLNTKIIDGIINASGTLSNYCSDDFYKAFLQQFNDLPMIYISQENETVNTIKIDNYQSIYKVMDHLFLEHSFKTFAFIKGPETNSEANERYRAFEDRMNREKISSNKFRAYQGDFSKESAIKAMKKMKKDGFIPDIIICANDEMAIGVHQFIYSNQFDAKLYKNCQFTGFDNQDNASTFIPAFTTIEQPLEKIGQLAVEGIDYLINNKGNHFNKTIPGQLIVRESCGCFRFNENSSLSIDVSTAKNHSFKGLHRNLNLEDFYSAFFSEKDENLLSIYIHLINEFFNEVSKDFQNQNFTKIYYYQLIEVVNNDLLLNKLYVFPEQLLSIIFEKTNKIPSSLLSLFNKLNRIIEEFKLSKNTIKSYELVSSFYYSSKLISKFTSIKTLKRIKDILIPVLKNLQLSNFYLCIFDEPVIIKDRLKIDYPKLVNMLFGYTDDGMINGYTFKSELMIPPSISNNFKDTPYVLTPLFFDNHYFGYIVSSINVNYKSIFRIISSEISNAIERLNVYKKLNLYNEKLKKISYIDSMTNIYNRRGIFKHIEDLLEITKINESHVIGVIYIDMNRLKHINDQYGHIEGDRAINKIAHILDDCLKNIGAVGRLGGDEFLGIINHLENGSQLEYIIEKIHLKIKYFNKEGQFHYPLSVSIGYNVWKPKNINSLEKIIKETDQKMYEQKKSNTN